MGGGGARGRLDEEHQRRASVKESRKQGSKKDGRGGVQGKRSLAGFASKARSRKKLGGCTKGDGKRKSGARREVGLLFFSTASLIKGGQSYEGASYLRCKG